MADYDKRALYYWAKLYSAQLRKGDNYSDLNKAIGIHILNFTSILESKKYHNIFHVTEKDSDIPYFKDLELHTIELKKFCHNANEELNEFIKRVNNALDIWLAFLTRNDLLNKDNLPKVLDDATLKRAINILDVMNMTEEERIAYEEREDWLRLEGSILKKSEEKGYERGREEGKLKQVYAIAKLLKTRGIDLNTIASATNLSAAEIEKL